jgi:hypothetical protein
MAQVADRSVPSQKRPARASTPPLLVTDVVVNAVPEAVPAAPSAIPDYASLAASQVVPRLAALTDSEVDEVAAYEMATRKRRTILAAVERHRS